MPRYKFEDIAFNITEKRMPVPEDKELYIGLEHLDTGCLWVTRWGSPVDIKGQKLVMHKGDLLFGRRNTYLRRAAIAPHDGLFSAHGMIFRPKTDVITAEFFPYFISSNYFMEAAIRISVGSLSPTVNWKQLKELEFDIPEIEDQSKYAELFSAIDRSREAYKTLITKTDELVKSQFIELFGDPVANTKGWPIKGLLEISESFIGLTYKPSDVSENGTLVLRSSNIQNSTLVFDDNVRVNTEIREKLYVKENDILMCSRNGSAALVGKVARIPALSEKMTFGAFMTIIRSEYSDYLFTYFQLPAFRQQVQTGTSTINQITQKMLEKVMLPVPPLTEIDSFSKIIKQSDKSKFEAKQAIQTLDSLYLNIEKKCFS